MPTYHYVCPNGHEFEHFERKISSRSRRKCPQCGKMAPRQISGGAGLIFKGSGFYITDYKRDGKAKDGPEKGASDEKSKKSDTKSAGGDAKTANSKPKGKDS